MVEGGRAHDYVINEGVEPTIIFYYKEGRWSKISVKTDYVICERFILMSCLMLNLSGKENIV